MQVKSKVATGILWLTLAVLADTPPMPIPLPARQVQPKVQPNAPILVPMSDMTLEMVVDYWKTNRANVCVLIWRGL